ncbi:hypothetical protein L6164_035497 [Bauhinia variegata]|uniref:Uncharacterized protein n=1 Tax=Bauhinia variegata TaxID=167791 RepID=A0ACB9KE47_BAUVA|nr:hypothetical protein L6164_035497 [Bauhinia variegata]
MDSGKRQSLKIVQIETSYIEIDAVNFRDVVQSLTGKDPTAGKGNHAAKAETAAKPDQLDSRDNNMSWQNLFPGFPSLDTLL